MNGNVWEWCTGLRMVYGEIQIIQDNNAADPTADLSAESAAWKAINAADGRLVTPDGKGTTVGTVKLDTFGGRWTYSTAIASVATAGGHSFAGVTVDATIGDAAKVLLQALAMLPDTDLAGDGIDINYGSDYFYADNSQAERCLFRGGSWYNNSHAGLFNFYLGESRSIIDGRVGGRSAFY